MVPPQPDLEGGRVLERQHGDGHGDCHAGISIQFLSFACFVVFHNFRLGDLKGTLAESIAVDMALDLVDQDR